MANYAHDTIEYHKERIREVLALNARASLRAIQNILEGHETTPLKLSLVYIAKLKKKIEAERAHRFDHALVETHLAKVQERNETIISTMWSILLDPKQKGRDRVSAAQTIIKADFELYQALLDGGVFERKLGTIDLNATLRNRPIPAEVKDIMLKALKAHLGPRTIAEPIKVESIAAPAAIPAQEQNGNANTTTQGPHPVPAPADTAGALG